MTYDPFFSDREPAPAAQRRSDGTWACVRADYLAGASAPQLAERYGVSLSAIRTRAREDGWRRADLPDPAAAGEEADDLAAAADASPAELRTLAWARAAAAVRRGRLAEALGWTRLVRQLDALAGKQAASPALQARAADSLARAADTLATLRRTRPASPPAPEMHDPHEVHGPDLPHERGSRRAPAARDGEEGSTPEAYATPSTISGGAPTLRAEEDEAVHDLHEVADPPEAADPPEVHDLHDLHEVHDLHLPPPRAATGPVLPSRPPGWVRHALGMR